VAGFLAAIHGERGGPADWKQAEGRHWLAWKLASRECCWTWRLGRSGAPPNSCPSECRELHAAESGVESWPVEARGLVSAGDRGSPNARWRSCEEELCLGCGVCGVSVRGASCRYALAGNA